ncbi:hypothetical protein J4H86_10200 [Spiractinospora alimapuensis]|uniref:hypothetical protein n=1 Tax=Spiractinospora alimapuensis TaxID=2820884 RepID=UPI001F2C070D|nr:hypothetical protein [Spiractinospora alimapuensis]QVQ54033.1 hypothetical protein J4H86_10200 [Spiractinospora alimapuensis]
MHLRWVEADRLRLDPSGRLLVVHADHPAHRARMLDARTGSPVGPGVSPEDGSVCVPLIPPPGWGGWGRPLIAEVCGTLRLWEATTGRVLREHPYPGCIDEPLDAVSGHLYGRPALFVFGTHRSTGEWGWEACSLSGGTLLASQGFHMTYCSGDVRIALLDGLLFTPRASWGWIGEDVVDVYNLQVVRTGDGQVMGEVDDVAPDDFHVAQTSRGPVLAANGRLLALPGLEQVARYPGLGSPVVADVGGDVVVVTINDLGGSIRLWRPLERDAPVATWTSPGGRLALDVGIASDTVFIALG